MQFKQTSARNDNRGFQELIEWKKVYSHPNYVFPRLYDDIALVQLGRRIPYNFTKVISSFYHGEVEYKIY